MIQKNKIIFLISLYIFLSGCATHSAISTEAFTPIYSSVNCPAYYKNTEAQLIKDSSNWVVFLSQTDSTIIPSGTKIDFEKNQILLVAMGEQPSAGYNISFNAAKQQENSLDVLINWQEPKDDKESAQVVTNPCLALIIPKEGFSDILVHTEDNEKLNINLNN